jgi:hypothetical protein
MNEQILVNVFCAHTTLILIVTKYSQIINNTHSLFINKIIFLLNVSAVAMVAYMNTFFLCWSECIWEESK